MRRPRSGRGGSLHTNGAVRYPAATRTNPEPVRVLQVVESCGAGVGRHVRILCAELAAGGHGVTVAYAPHRLDEAFERFIEDKREEIRFVPLGLRREVSPGADMRSVWRLLRLIRSEGPFDVVHGHSSKGGAVARLAGRLAGVPAVYTPHGLVLAYPDFSKLQTAIYTTIERTLGYCATSRLISVSAQERELVRELGLAPERRVVTVENGIEDSEFEHFRDLDRSLQGRGSLTFGSVMRFSREKAPDMLVDAFVRLAKKNPRNDSRLVIAGDGPLFEQTRDQVRESGFEERISLLGWRTDIREILESLDVYVLSSLSEGGPYSILEAMAGKLPIVSTSVSGIEDTVARVPGNVVVPAGDPAALAEGMGRMATASVTRWGFRRIGEANHAYAREHYRQEVSTLRTLQLYRELCSERGVTGAASEPRLPLAGESAPPGERVGA